MTTYVDSSALLKLYVDEADSDDARRFIAVHHHGTASVWWRHVDLRLPCARAHPAPLGGRLCSIFRLRC